VKMPRVARPLPLLLTLFACTSIGVSAQGSGGAVALDSTDDTPRSIDCPEALPYLQITHGNATCVTSCSPGSAPDQNKRCTACKVEAPFSDPVSKSCVADCPSHLVPFQASCIQCEGAFPYVDQMTKTCVQSCPAGQSPTDEGICEACPKSKPFADFFSKECVQLCPEGKDENTDLVCVCPKGRVSNRTGGCEVCSEDKPYSLQQRDHDRCVAECPAGHVPTHWPHHCEACNSTHIYVLKLGSAAKCVSSCPEDKPALYPGATCGETMQQPSEENYEQVDAANATLIALDNYLFGH